MKSLLRRFTILTSAGIILAQSSALPAWADSNPFELYEEEAKVVTASKSSEKLSDAPGVISVFSKDDLERFGGTTLSDILQKIPGLTRSSVYMTDRSMIAIRGGQFKDNGGHVLLLINGRPIREVLEGGIESEVYESFPINIIERIEVIKGPGSVLYGTNAVAGVINIITEQPKENKLTVTALGGEKGTTEDMGKASVKHGDLSVTVAGMYHKKPTWNLLYDWDNFGTTVHQQTHIPDSGTGAFSQVNYKNLSVMSSFNRWDNTSFIPDFGFLGGVGSLVREEKKFADAGYHQEFNSKWNSNINLTYSGSDMNIYGWPYAERHSYELLGEWTHFIHPIDALDIVAGGTFAHDQGHEYTTNSNPPVLIVSGSRNNYTFYSQMGYKLRDTLRLIGGIQANKVGKDDWDVVPRGGLILKPMSDLNVKLMYAQSYKAPTIHETSINFAGLLGNPDLKSEKISTYDIDIDYRIGKCDLGADFFYEELRNIIFQDRSGPIPQYQNSVGKTVASGAEWKTKVYATHEWMFEGSMLYQTSRDQASHQNVTPIANWSGKAGVSYRSDVGISISLFDNYQGGLDNRYDTTLNPTPGHFNQLDLNSRFDMAKLIGWKRTRGLALLFRVDNLLDRQLWLPAWGLAAGTSMPVEAGRTIYLGAEVSF